MSRDIDQLLESDYDGIQEYDNDLPLWWLGLFFITIAFGVVYSGYMHIARSDSDQQRFAAEMAAEQQQAATRQTNVDPADTEKTLLALVADSKALEQGKGVFTARCVACHGPDGQGLVGPNLTDDYWLHGGKIADIKLVVENGVPEKGMLAWKAMLPASEIDSVVAYIYSIHGSNPPNPKAPQGELAAR